MYFSNPISVEHGFSNLISDYQGRFKPKLVNFDIFLSNFFQPWSFHTESRSIMVFSFAVTVDNGPFEVDTCRPVFCFQYWSTKVLSCMVWVIHCHFLANIGQSWSLHTQDCWNAVFSLQIWWTIFVSNPISFKHDIGRQCPFYPK